MRRFIVIGLSASLGLMLACSMIDNSPMNKPACDCDTLQTKKIVTNKNFNRISQYDTVNFSESDFYNLDSSINRTLWYRDIENIDTTKFTNLWNDYLPANYHASQMDFVEFYKGRKDIELAFQFGPNMDLWAYHIFVIKKINCCYLVTRSYFRHARFTYKAYSIINNNQLDILYSILKEIDVHPIGDKEEFKYSGYFVDNRNKKNYFIDFEKEEEKAKAINKEENSKKKVDDLYEFVDKKISWTKTYSL